MRFTRGFSFAIRSIVASSVLALFAMGAWGQNQMGAIPPGFNPNVGPYPHGQTAEGAELLKRGPEGDESPTNEPKLSEEETFRLAYPEIFRTEGVIVMFGADWCRWCGPQKRVLKARALEYNVLTYDVDTERGRKLADHWKLGRSIPVTIVATQGKVTKAFTGLTAWSDIKPYAKRAKKNERNKKGSIDIGPIHIDWDDGSANADDEKRYRRNKRRG